VVKIGTFIHIEGLVNNKEKTAYLYLDSLEKLKVTEKLLFEEAKKQRAELFI
jgi:hypothetical protein